MSKAITFVRPGVQPNGFIEETYFDTDGAVDSNWTNISGGAGTFNSGVFSGVAVAYARRWNPAIIGGTPGNPKVIGGSVDPADIWGSTPSSSPQLIEATTSVNLINGANNNIATVGTTNFARVVGPSGAFSISGFAAGTDGAVLTIWNSTSQTMTITNNATSVATNRILTGTGADFVVAGLGAVQFTYSASDSRWLMTGRASGTGVGTVTSVSGGTTGLSVATATSTPTLGGVLVVANGGTGSLNGAPTPAITSAASGAIAIPTTSPAEAIITYAAGNGAYTLAAPTAGAPGTGNDGQKLTIVSASARAHVITGGVDGFNAKGASGTLTFGGAIGDSCELIAYNGHWYVSSSKNVTAA